MIVSETDSLNGRIVCGTDFSALASEAANAAAVMTMRLKQPLLLFPAPPENLHGELPASVRDWLLGLVHERLLAEATRLHRLGAVVEARMLDGLADEGIAECFQNCDAALVLLGASEHELRKRCLAGETVDALAEWSPISTLLVRTAEPFQQWTRGERALRILVASDPAKSSQDALRCVRGLRRIGPCEVTIGYALDDSTEGDADTPTPQEIAALVGDENVAVCVMHGPVDVYRTMLDLARETHPDLLVVGSPQHHDLTPWPHLSVARAVLRHFPLNVICAPRQVAPLTMRTPGSMSAAIPAPFASLP